MPRRLVMMDDFEGDYILCNFGYSERRRNASMETGKISLPPLEMLEVDEVSRTGSGSGEASPR